MKKLSSEDWLLAGLTALRRNGEDAIRIDKLCTDLNVSKGSFYHHFKNIDDYVISLMKFWIKENTRDIIVLAEEGQSLEEKAERLNSIVINKDHLIEVRVRAWSVRDKKIKAFVDMVDAERIEYLKSFYLKSGVLEEKAFDLARLEYCAFVGEQHLLGDLPITEKQRLSELFRQLLKSYIQ